jgi:hypothetical protein
MHNRDSNNNSKNHLTPTMENYLKAALNLTFGELSSSMTPDDYARDKGRRAPPTLMKGGKL